MKIFFAQVLFDELFFAGGKIVVDGYLPAPFSRPVRQMTADKARPAGDKYFSGHQSTPQ